MSFLRRKSMSKSSRRVHRTSTGKEFHVGGAGGKTPRPMSVMSTGSERSVTWEDCVPPAKLDSLLNRERQRQKVIFELTSTEGDYLRDLATLRDLFRSTLVRAECTPLSTVTALFSNLDDVIRTNEELFDRLAKRPVDGVVESCVADIFVDMFTNNRFDSYLEFCANQLPASELYGTLLKENPKFADVMRHCADQTGGFDLPAFLLKGMQRLLKYNPLLEQVKKRTKESDYAALSLLDKAMELVDVFGKKVNERLRASENARRLPQIQAALVCEPSARWAGSKDLDLDLTADRSRKLVHEGRLKYVKPQAPGSVEIRTDPVYVVMLSDMLLLAEEREDKYILQGKDPVPIIYMGAVADFRAEITLPDRIRSTLCIEIGEGELEVDGSILGQGRDGPRPVLPVTRKSFVRLQAPTQKQLQVWMQALKDTRRKYLQAHSELQRSVSQASSAGREEYAVTMLVTSMAVGSAETSRESSTDDRVPDSAAHFPRDDVGDGVADWGITFKSTSEGGEAVSEVTRSIRLVQGPEGLGFTLIGRAPVEFQEVEMESPAWRAGIRVGDKIRAVNGQECTNSAHHEVVGLIQEALSTPVRKSWIPVSTPLNAIQEGDVQSLGSLGRTGRSLRKALLTDPSEVN